MEPIGDSCRLMVTRDQLRNGANDQLFGGWPMILSGLKRGLKPAKFYRRTGRSVQVC
jgi:hypothetical protein